MKTLLASIAIAISLAACGPNNVQQAAPAVIESAQQASSGVDAGSAALGAVAGGLAGMALGNAIGKAATPAQTVVVQPHPAYSSGYNRSYVPAPRTIQKTTVLRKNPITGAITKTTTIRRR